MRKIARMSKALTLCRLWRLCRRAQPAFYMEVKSLSLEALSRNGHNLQLGEFECAGPYQIPVIQPVPAVEELRWIPFNSARTDALRGAHGVHFLSLIHI